MKIAILADVLDEHSGARAGFKLAQALALAAPSDQFILLTAIDRLSPWARQHLPGNLRVVKFKKSFLFSLDLVGKIRQEKVDLISAHCSLRLLISARLTGVRIVRTDYGTQFPSFNGRSDGWRPEPGVILVNFIGDIVVYGRDFLKFWLAGYNLAISRDGSLKAKKLFGQKIGYIYLGCDNLELPSGNLSGSQSIEIVSVSRFVPYKGFHLLVKVFNNLSVEYPQIKLTLIGGQAEPRYFKFLKELTADSNRIEILIDAPDELLSQIFVRSQIYASATRWEALGLPFLEASRAGLPTLGFAFFGPSAEVVLDGQTGFLATDLADFERKLEKLIVDHQLRRSMGESGRKFASQFTWDKTAREYLEVFREV